MKLKYAMAVQKVADGYVAVTVGEDASKFSGLIRLNATGAYMLEQMKEEISEEELIKRLSAKYDADEAELRTAAKKFIDRMREEGFLE